MYDTRAKRMTAVELLIIVLVLSTLAAISVPRLSHSATLDKQMQCNSNLELLQEAVDLHSSQKGKFPNTLEEVMNNREFFPVRAPKCPLGGTYFMKFNYTVICTHP
jgi:general secretion pathway protein G